MVAQATEIATWSPYVVIKVPIIEAGLQVRPKDPVLLNNLGICLMLKEDYVAAARRFIDASAVVPEDPRYRANLASALAMQGRYDEALALYLQVVSPCDAHYNVAVLCEARKDSVRANQEYKQAVIEAFDLTSAGSPASAPAE